MIKKMMLHAAIGLVCCVGITHTMDKEKILQMQRSGMQVVDMHSIIQNGIKHVIVHAMPPSDLLLAEKGEVKESYDCKIAEPYVTKLIEESRGYLECVQQSKKVALEDKKVDVFFNIVSSSGDRAPLALVITKSFLDRLEKNINNPLPRNEIFPVWLTLPLCSIEGTQYRNENILFFNIETNDAHDSSKVSSSKEELDKIISDVLDEVEAGSQNHDSSKMSYNEEEIKKIIDNLIVAIKYNKTLNGLRAILSMGRNTF